MHFNKLSMNRVIYLIRTVLLWNFIILEMTFMLHIKLRPKLNTAAFFEFKEDFLGNYYSLRTLLDKQLTEN